MDNENEKNKPDFVLVDQPNIPDFITGKKREKILKALEEEAVRKIDPTRDEDYKVQFFEIWKKDREKEGKPLTPKEEKYYKSLRDDRRLIDAFVVIFIQSPGAELLIDQGIGVINKFTEPV